MAVPTLTCPTCNGIVTDVGRPIEEVLAGASDDKVAAVQRSVRAKCPKCGPRIVRYPDMGHHSTHIEKAARKRYNKDARTCLKRHLEPAAYKRFVATFNGKLVPPDEERARWEAVLSQHGR